MFRVKAYLRRSVLKKTNKMVDHRANIEPTLLFFQPVRHFGHAAQVFTNRAKYIFWNILDGLFSAR